MILCDLVLSLWIGAGFPAVGFAPNYGIFPFQASQFLTLDDVLEGADSNNAVCSDA